VYLIRRGVALVHTVDFFTPVVDDAYDFGCIAAANALSDIYAMGAKPLTALCIVCFPIDEMDARILEDMLRGGVDKLREARVELLGGHSVKDRELKFGFAVTGTADPSRLVLKSGARTGDLLVLTKPLGTGVLSTALKAGRLTKAKEREITGVMSALNWKASEAMLKAGAHACTDVTGFGLLGHAFEMAAASNCTLVIDSSAVPIMEGVLPLIREGLFPGGLKSVREFLKRKMRSEAGVSDEIVSAMCDPQTSGGLLISVPAKKARGLLRDLVRGNSKTASIIGRVARKESKSIVLQ